MNKDAPAIPANEPDSDIFTIASRRKTCVLILVFGAALGILVGILNVLAMDNQWALQDDFFDIVDAPVISLISAAGGVFSIFYPIGLWLVLFGYWAIISLFVASLICLVHTRVIRDIIRDKICRYTLFFGTCGGIFVGVLSFLATANGWNDLENCFNILNKPVNSMIDALQDKYDILDSLAADQQKEFVFKSITAVVYWIVIGLLVALFPCVVRILRKRRAARDMQAYKGMIHLCRSGASEQASR